MLSKIQRDTLSKTVTAFRALSLALTCTINTSISPLSECSRGYKKVVKPVKRAPAPYCWFKSCSSHVAEWN